MKSHIPYDTSFQNNSVCFPPPFKLSSSLILSLETTTLQKSTGANIKGFQSQMCGFKLLIGENSATNDQHWNNEQCCLYTVIPSLSWWNKGASFSISNQPCLKNRILALLEWHCCFYKSLTTACFHCSFIKLVTTHCWYRNIFLYMSSENHTPSSPHPREDP